MASKFTLEVYDADSVETVAFHLSSDLPFGSVSVGDLLHFQTMNMHERLKVTRIEHLFWEVEGIVKQKTCVYTIQSDLE